MDRLSKIERTIVGVAAYTTLLCAGTALAIPSTPQQKCDYARITAWKVYTSCVDTVVAKEATGVSLSSFDMPAAFAKCRHTYFKKWAAFQPRASLATTTCIGTRYTDNGTTVTDNLSGLVWEKKTNDSSDHDKDNTETWSTGSPFVGDGTAYYSFLININNDLFDGAADWRLPTLAELQTIVLDFACKGTYGGPACICGSTPCVDPALDAGNTQSSAYWSATSYVPLSDRAWFVNFNNGSIGYRDKTLGFTCVRAGRGGF